MSSPEMVDNNLTPSRPSLVDKRTPSDVATPSTFPSTPDEGAGVACTDDVVPCGLAPAPLNPYASLLEPTISQPFPLPSNSPHPLPTPLHEDRPDLSRDFAGSALPPTDVSLPTPPIVKNTHNLRLPSFDVLGIAAPHPDRIALRSKHSFSPLGAGPLSKPEDPLHALSPPLAQPQQFGGVDEPSPASPKATRAQVQHVVPIATPPTEPGAFNWGSFVNVKTVGWGSPPSSDPGVSPNIHTAVSAFPPAPASTTNPLSVVALSDALGMAAWVERVKDIITSDFQSQPVDSVKVLSHALPCPSLTGHLFGQIIAAIHEKSPTPTAWINVFHAVPGRFTLSDLPKSPPSTPGPAVGGDEYFTSKVFDSAVAVPDYQLDSKLLPPSPRPVVPPGSVHVSVVERYIPPTNVNEFAEMFQLKGRSLLYDRLVELSSNNGMLLFIYPTKTGAKTFMREYLGPILDPLLRSITVVHDLSSDLGKSLGRMIAVDRLAEYDTLHAELQKFCQKVNDNTPLTGSANKKTTYSVIHASKEEIMLERSAWASDWWIKQEKPRVRELVTKFFRKKLPTSDMTSTTLIQEVLDGVAHREYQSSNVPKGVEVGVFIVKKSACG